MISKYFSIIRNYVISFFAKKVHFLPPKRASRCFSNEFSQNYWQESFDGDSFVSKSSFDAYACQNTQKASLWKRGLLVMEAIKVDAWEDNYLLNVVECFLPVDAIWYFARH